MRQPSEIRQEQLDRLVDRELNATEYQELLRELAQDPEGWQRCAMAFLEAQAFSSDLKAVSQPQRQRETNASTRLGKPSSRLASWVTIAASLLLAFGFGGWVQGWLVDGNRKPTGDASQQFTNVSSDNVNAEERERVEQTAIGEQTGVRKHGIAADAQSERIRLLVNDRDFVDVPVNEADAINFEEIFRKENQAYERILRDLERQGHVVRRTQREVPVQLEDGRRARVPVDRIEIVPVRGNYQ